MCIGICSSCFYYSQPYVKIYHQPAAPVQSTALQLIRPKIQPLIAVAFTFRILNSNLISSSFLCASYGSLYLLSSQCCLKLCSLLFLLSKVSLSIPLGLVQSGIVRFLKSPIFVDASLVAHILSLSISFGLNLTHCISKLRSHNSSSNRFDMNSSTTSCIQISSSTSALSWLTKHSNSLLFSQAILDYGCLNSTAALGSIGIKVLVLIL